MSSRSDHGIRLPRADAGTTPRRSRVATSLPEGLPHYELRRVLRPIENEPALWEHAIEHDDDFVPLLAESSPPPFDPIDPAMILGAPSPIEIEIGTGKGGFLSGYAQLHPERPILGIEWTRPIAWYAAQKFTRRPHLTHAKVLWADANFFLRDRMPAGCCNAFHVYFPDPWPKKGNRKRRIMQPPLLEQMRRLAVPGCLLHWGTDYQEYDESTRDLLSSTDGFRLLVPDAPPTDGVMTSFEKKYRQEGRPIHRSVWEISPAG